MFTQIQILGTLISKLNARNVKACAEGEQGGLG